jgi:hypothetical protein
VLASGTRQTQQTMPNFQMGRTIGESQEIMLAPIVFVRSPEVISVVKELLNFARGAKVDRRGPPCARLFGFGRYVVAFNFSRGRDCSIFVDTCRARKAVGWFIPHFAQFVPETIWLGIVDGSDLSVNVGDPE